MPDYTVEVTAAPVRDGDWTQLRAVLNLSPGAALLESPDEPTIILTLPASSMAAAVRAALDLIPESVDVERVSVQLADRDQKGLFERVGVARPGDLVVLRCPTDALDDARQLLAGWHETHPDIDVVVIQEDCAGQIISGGRASREVIEQVRHLEEALRTVQATVVGVGS